MSAAQGSIVVRASVGDVERCQRSQLGRLRACGEQGRVIELDAQLLNDAGFGMLEASERVHRAAYPEPSPP